MEAAILLALVAVAAWILWRHRRTAARQPQPAPSRPRGGRRRERYTQVGVSRTYLQRTVPKPGDNSPLTPWLAKAIDPAVPAPASGEAVPYDDEEIRAMLLGVLRRVNARSDLELSLVSFDSVTKTVDQFKTLRYETNANVYSKTKALASKVLVAVDVTADGKTYVRDLRVHGAAKDAGGAAPSNGIGFEERYAAFEPAVKYIPQ